MAGNFTFYTANQLNGNNASGASFQVRSTTGAGVAYDATTSVIQLYDRTPQTPIAFTTEGSIFFSSSSGNVQYNTIILQNINFKKFEVYHNGHLTMASSVEGTLTANWNNFTSANVILQFPTTTATGVSIYVYSTTNAAPFQIGQIILCDTYYELPRNPAFADYKPVLSGNRITKEMADGGSVVYSVSEKFEAEIGLNWVPQSVATDLLAMYRDTEPKIFIPYPTITGWNGEAWEVNWVGDYTFKHLAYDDRTNPYFKGKLKLMEVAG